MRDPTFPGGKLKAAQSEHKIDPIFGVRYNQYFTKKFHVAFQGDIGGFGLGEDTMGFSYTAQPILCYDFTMMVVHFPSTWMVGYKILGIQNYTGSANNGTEEGFNLRMHGIVLGLNCVLF